MHSFPDSRSEPERVRQGPLRGLREQAKCCRDPQEHETSDFHDHDGPGGKPTGIDGDEQMMLSMYKVMPDLHLTIEDMIAEGDKAVCRNIWRWTDAASGKKMQFYGFVLWRFEGEKIAERWATVTSAAEGVSWTTEEARKAPAKRAN